MPFYTSTGSQYESTDSNRGRTEIQLPTTLTREQTSSIQEYRQISTFRRSNPLHLQGKESVQAVKQLVIVRET